MSETAVATTWKPPISAMEWRDIALKLSDEGYGREFAWCQYMPPCSDAETFGAEYVWVVVNAGMKNQVAQRICERIMSAFERGQTATSVFGYEAKARAIDRLWEGRCHYFGLYQAAPDKLEWLLSLPFIGPITKFHLARNLGIDVAKPDRHLQRIADLSGETVQGMCERIAGATGFRVGAVDVVLWRAANLRWIELGGQE